MEKGETNKGLVLGQIFVIFILPIVVLYFNLINKEWRVLVLLVACTLIYGIITKEGWQPKDWGLRFDTLRHTLIPYLAFTLVSVTFVIWFASKLDMRIETYWWLDRHFWFIFLLVSVLQEFAYRGFLIPLLQKIISDRLGIVFINALLFTLLHVIYPVPSVMLPLAFIGGLGFAMMYTKYPNIIWLSLSHAVINFVAVLYGFFVIYH